MGASLQARRRRTRCRNFGGRCVGDAADEGSELRGVGGRRSSGAELRLSICRRGGGGRGRWSRRSMGRRSGRAGRLVQSSRRRAWNHPRGARPGVRPRYVERRSGGSPGSGPSPGWLSGVSLRPRAWALRRFRFSRSAALRRSVLACDGASGMVSHDLASGGTAPRALCFTRPCVGEGHGPAGALAALRRRDPLAALLSTLNRNNRLAWVPMLPPVRSRPAGRQAFPRP